MFLGIVLSNAQNVNVDLTINLNGKIKCDSVYLFLYSTTSVELGQQLPNPAKKFVFHNLKNEFQMYPGAYTMAVLAFGYKSLVTRFYIPPVQNYTIGILMNPQIIGWGGITEIEQIKEVTLRGDFNQYGENGEIPLIKKGEVWKLDEKPDVLKGAKEYTFYVNDQETSDLLNPNVVSFAPWYALKNVYTNNELIFDPSLYSLVYKESELILADSIKQNQFKQMIGEINLLEKEKNKIFQKATSREAALLSIDSLITQYSIIEKNYPAEISQIIIEKELGLQIIKYLGSAPHGNRNDEQVKDKQKKYMLGEESGLYFKQINGLINKLDPNSFLLNAEFAQSLKTMQDILNEFPEMTEKHNLQETYYQEFLDNFVNKSPNKKLCYSILMTQAYMNQKTDEAKTVAIIEGIEKNPAFADFINQEQIDRIRAQMNIKLGKPAPDFSVDLLSGKKINLGDYSGKFVFIDFWGSWCAPCRDEIPNIKKLYRSVSRDKLEIIGLAQDDETKLRNYIREQNIEYPNALAPIELLSKYGVSKYPTSYLINPKGKIVRIDVRGPDAMELIKEEIEDYFN